MGKGPASLLWHRTDFIGAYTCDNRQVFLLGIVAYLVEPLVRGTLGRISVVGLGSFLLFKLAKSSARNQTILQDNGFTSELACGDWQRLRTCVAPTLISTLLLCERDVLVGCEVFQDHYSHASLRPVPTVCSVIRDLLPSSCCSSCVASGNIDNFRRLRGYLDFCNNS